MSQTLTATAVVAHGPDSAGVPQFKYSSGLKLNKSEPGPNELLVKVLAAGICHTDLVVNSVPSGYFGLFPKILGHEGSGYVEAVGSNVTVAAVGDPVLLSYTYCNDCDLCKRDQPTYCDNFNRDNVDCPEKVWEGSGDDGIGGKFFGQSSFASRTVVDEKSVVNVKGLIKDDDELKSFSPLGCGLMTGSGAIVNTANAGANDGVLIAGLGAVGLGAIMAAKIQGCRAIIAVDRIKSRLELAKQLGATHLYDTSHLDIKQDDYAQTLAEEVKKLIDGKINFALDTTGVLPLINAQIKALSKRGKFIQIGVPIPVPTTIIPFDMQDFFGGTKRMEVNYLGDCLAKDHLPKMIQWYRDGKFPFDKLIKFYDAKDIGQAIEDMKSEVIKPIIIH